MLEAVVLQVGMVSLTCSAVLLPLLLLARRLRNRYAARTCYFVWLLLALRLALPFSITLPTPAVTVEAPSYTVTLPGDRGTTVLPTTPNVPEAQPAAPPLAGVPESPEAFPSMPEASAEPPRTVSLLEILGAVWLAGAAVYGAYFLLTYIAARRRLLSRAEPAGEDETAQLRSIAEKAGCRRAARLYQSEDIHSPMMLGLLRPAILLPAYPIDEEEQAIILWHELTHLKRRDVAYKLLLLIANGVHWFNPLVWWMTREASRNVELCCDDDVVRWRGKEFRRLYGEVLLRTAQESGPTPALSTRFGGGKAQMKERLSNLFRRKRHSAKLVCCVFLAALLTGALVACESNTFTLSGKESVKSEQIQPLRGTVTVSADRDTDVVFTDVETGEEYKIGYLTPGVSEKIKLEKGKWYAVAGGGTLTVGPVNVRVVDKANDAPDENAVLDANTISYVDQKRGFVLQFPEEWEGLVEMVDAGGDGSVLTLYHAASRREDDPTAGVLANLCADTIEDFNALYGDTDLNGMYESGGPRIWALGTTNGYLISLQVGGRADQGVEFDRILQQLQQSPCVTFVHVSTHLLMAAPGFLTEEQRNLYRKAGFLYESMFGGDTTFIDYYRSGDTPRPDPDPYESVELDGYTYLLAKGIYRRWEDFDAAVHGVFTDAFWEEHNNSRLGNEKMIPIYRDIDGRLGIIDLSRGSGYYYNDNFPDEFRLDSQTDDTISFTLIGHYSLPWPREGETYEERDRRWAQGYEYTLEFPIKMVLTENGWRFDEFHSALADEEER